MDYSIERYLSKYQNGDELTYVTDGDKGQIIYRQAGTKTQKMVGEITDERMNDAFLSIWLSPKRNFQSCVNNL